MDNFDEFKTIYEEMKQESLKDQEMDLEKELEKNVALSENNINEINEFLKDSECVQDLNNFIFAFNRQNLINSKFYQKNKGFHYFEDFISFKNLKFKCHKDNDKKDAFVKYFSSLDLIPEKKEIQELIDSSSLSEKKKESIIKNDSKSIELNKSGYKGNINKSNENLSKSKKLNKSVGEISLSPKKDYKEKTKDNLEFEKIEMSNGISYENNAIDFIKYALCYSFLKKEITIPGLVNMKFDDKLLEKAGVANLKVTKDSVKFDLAIKDMSKEDMVKFFNRIKKNVFQKEKLDLDSESNHNFDLLIEVARNYFYQSQDKYAQINAYILLIKILNYLRDINEEDENYMEFKKLNEIICDKLKVNEKNEKILILITNGSYHLLSQIIKFSNKNKFEDIEKKEEEKKGKDNANMDKETHKILSDLIKDTSISKTFSFLQNNRNIPNLNKFLNILSDLDKSNLKYSIIYFEDDIKISLENYILNEIMFQEKYNHAELKKFHENYKMILENIQKSDYTNIKNLSFKKEMNDFINLLTTTKSEIKIAFDNYYNSLMENENIKIIAEKIKLDIGKYSFFNNNIAKIYLVKDHPSTKKIVDDFKAILNCDFKYLELHIKNYSNYLATVGGMIDIWLSDILRSYLTVNYRDNIYFTNDEFLETKNILEVIQYNFNKYFNDKYEIDKNIDISSLNYDSSSKADSEFFEKLSKLLDTIFEKFQKLFDKNTTKKQEIIYSIINNCKCKCIYFLVFNQIHKVGLAENRNSLSGKILNLVKKFLN